MARWTIDGRILGRLRAALPDAAAATVAAALSWLLARALFGHPQPLFAPIAADLEREGADNVPDEWKPLIGTYYANFGALKNSPFQVVFRCGKLALDIPSELVYELKEPDKEGRWQLVANNATAVSFKKDSEGKVLALLLHRPKTTVELPRDKPVDAEPLKK